MQQGFLYFLGNAALVLSASLLSTPPTQDQGGTERGTSHGYVHRRLRGCSDEADTPCDQLFDISEPGLDFKRPIPHALGDVDAALEELRREHDDNLETIRRGQDSQSNQGGQLRQSPGISHATGTTLINTAKTNLPQPRFYQSVADATYRNGVKITKLEFYLESVIDEMYDNFRAMDNRVTAILQKEIEPLKMRMTTAETHIGSVETALGNYQAATDIAMSQMQAGLTQLQSETDKGMQEVREDIVEQVGATKEKRPRPIEGGSGTGSIFKN